MNFVLFSILKTIIYLDEDFLQNKSSKEKVQKRRFKREGSKGKVQKEGLKGGIKREPWFPLWVVKTDSWKVLLFPIDCLVPFAFLPFYLSWMCPHP
jgi:hypothetical protein